MQVSWDETWAQNPHNTQRALHHCAIGRLSSPGYIYIFFVSANLSLRIHVMEWSNGCMFSAGDSHVAINRTLRSSSVENLKWDVTHFSPRNCSRVVCLPSSTTCLSFHAPLSLTRVRVCVCVCLVGLKPAPAHNKCQCATRCSTRVCVNHRVRQHIKGSCTGLDSWCNGMICIFALAGEHLFVWNWCELPWIENGNSNVRVHTQTAYCVWR